MVLLLATLLAAIGGVQGIRALRHGHRSRATVVCMAAAFGLQLTFLVLRGEQRGACPLMGLGEILAFLAWSLTLIYLIVGPTYRLSLLGVFSAPVVVIFQGVALLPGMLSTDPQRVTEADPWRETHAATSVLGYGALGLAAVAAVMFLVLDRQLKARHMNSGLFRNLPPVRELLISSRRLVWLGWLILTVGVLAGFQMARDGVGPHLAAAVVVWVAYGVLVAVAQFRGLAGRRFALLTVAFFLASLSVFIWV